jgi:AAA15 family ATPase/GTPase
MPSSLNEKPENLKSITIKGRKDKKVSISKLLAIYGKNASGKSNVIEALQFFNSFVLSSLKKYDSGDKIPVQPFRLNKTTISDPSHFEAVFTDSCILYRYGFEIDSNNIVKEWFYWSPNGIESKIFERELDNVSLGRDFTKGKASINLMRSNSLFISAAAQTNLDFGNTVINFVKKFIIYDPNDMDNTLSVLGDLAKEEYLSIIQSALNYADVGIQQVKRREPTEKELKKLLDENLISKEDLEQLIEAKQAGKSFIYRLEFEHTSAEEIDNNYFNQLDESVGTVKFMALIAIAIKAFIEGGVIIIDEIDASLHTELSSAFIKLFTSVCSHNSQLLFTTHNTNLLNGNLFRRDQVWIADKNFIGESKLTCVSEFNTRKESNLEKLYLDGYFSGIPVFHHGHQSEMIQRFRSILEKHSTECEVANAEKK